MSGGDEGVEQHEAGPPTVRRGEAAGEARTLALGGRSGGEGTELVVNGLVGLKRTGLDAVEATDLRGDDV